jgi:hypothetical protein
MSIRCLYHLMRAAPVAVSFTLLFVVAGKPTACAAPPKMAKRKPTAATDGATEVKLVRVPNRGIQPQTAVDTEGTLHMIYLGDEPGAANVYYVRKAAGSDDDKFSKPVRVNSQYGSAIAIGSIRGAHLALGKANRVHVAWNGSGMAEPKGDAKYGNPMLYSRLTEDGSAFEPQRNVIREAYGLDGGGSVAADLDGNIYVAWHAGDGTGEINRRVWVVHSADDGESFDAEKPADSNKEGVCGCCGMKAYADREGTLYLFYRSAREKVNRDMALLTSTNHGKSFRSDIAGNWVIPTCPMSSEAFAETPEEVLAGWETDGKVFFTRIDKKKHRLSSSITPQGAGAGRKHPALAVNGKGETILAWTEGTGWERGGSLGWQIFDERGKPTKARGKTDGIPVWSFPAAYADADDSFVIAY